MQPGDIVFHNGWIMVINCITIRQRRGMCARLTHTDGSGWWVEVGKLRPFGLNAHAWQLED